MKIMGEIEVKRRTASSGKGRLEISDYKVPSSVKVSMPSSCCIFSKVSKARTFSAQAETLVRR